MSHKGRCIVCGRLVSLTGSGRVCRHGYKRIRNSGLRLSGNEVSGFSILKVEVDGRKLELGDRDTKCCPGSGLLVQMEI